MEDTWRWKKETRGKEGSPGDGKEDEVVSARETRVDIARVSGKEETLGETKTTGGGSGTGIGGGMTGDATTGAGIGTDRLGKDGLGLTGGDSSGLYAPSNPLSGGSGRSLS